MIDLSAPVRDWLPTVCYPGYMPGLPDIWLGRWPAVFRRSGSARFKPWYVETPAERAALLAALARAVPRIGAALDFRSGPDAATARPSALARGFIGLYIPPDAGWPWLTVVGIAHAPVHEATALELGRGAYAIEAFEAEAPALDHLARLRAMMPDATVILPDRSGLS